MISGTNFTSDFFHSMFDQPVNWVFSKIFVQFLNFAWMNHYLRFLTCCDKSVYLEISIIFYSEHTLGSKECICFKIFAKQVISWIGIESKYSKSSRQSESFDKTNFNFPSISNSNFSKEGSRFRRRSLRLTQHL